MDRDIVILCGHKKQGVHDVAAPISSVLVIILKEYCEIQELDVSFSPEYEDNNNLMDLESDRITWLSDCIFDKRTIPQEVFNCHLPVITSHKGTLYHSGLSHKGTLYHSGLCAVMRQIVKKAAEEGKNPNIVDLLGYHQNCLKAPAESSVWTKFCEIEMIQLTENYKSEKGDEIPEELLKLESHFNAPCSIANKGKRKLQEKKRRKKAQDINHVTDNVEIELPRLYAEGLDLYLTDLILFPCIALFMNKHSNFLDHYQKHLPKTFQWINRMQEIPQLKKVLEKCGIYLVPVTVITESISDLPTDKGTGERSESSCSKKFKIQPQQLEVIISNLQNSNCTTCISEHPGKSDMKLHWEQLPSPLNPCEGDLPVKRIERKCQQLENLVSAVRHIAQPGDKIVDFCSGGGHLGILLGYFLPDCQIYLVENKEESIVKAQQRIERLKLKNTTLFKCNLDYFIGKFDVGVCLHACGVATDLVLQKCLDSNASFVICPCCYGGIKETHTMSYPRSKKFKDSQIKENDYLMLGHAADQTEISIPQAAMGKKCMQIIDTDRAGLAIENGYDVTLCSLEPLTCSPKNNLLIGKKTS